MLRNAGSRVIVVEGLFGPAREGAAGALPAVAHVYLTEVDRSTDCEASRRWFLAFDRVLGDDGTGVGRVPGGRSGRSEEVGET